MNWRQILSVGTVPLVIGSIALAASMQSSRDPTVRLAQPHQWVPFEADYLINNASEQQRYKRYRAADGSFAHYLVPDGPVTIHNITLGRTFVRAKGSDEWFSYPIDPTTGQAAQTIVTSMPFKESTLTITDETVNGLPVYEFRGSSGSVTLIVPGLNGLPLRAYDPYGKLLAEYTNIHLGPPDDSVFAPPVGATVKVADKPLGYNQPQGKPHRE
jgi:hypothetical protein